jgi:hypothetical protein
MADNQPKRRQKTLTSEMVELLRSKNTALTKECNSLRNSLRAAENELLHFKSRTVRAEEDREAIFDAIRALSDVVSNDTMQGRRARQEARKLLETQKIRPPSALGSSRGTRIKRRRCHAKVLDDQQG